MKLSFKILALLVSGVLIACAGGNSAKKPPDKIPAGMKATTKGIVRYNQGCYQHALDYFLKAHELFSASDQLSGVAMSLNNIGNVYRIMGDSKSAVLFFEESFKIYTEIVDHKGAVQVLSNKAAALIAGGRLEEAAENLDAAEALARKKWISYTPLLNNRAILLTKTKDYTQAEKILKKALARTDSTDSSALATVNFALGKLMLASQRYEDAIRFLEAALVADRSTGFYKGIADDLAAIGTAYLNLDNKEAGINYLKRSIKVYALIGNVKKVEEILYDLENISKISGYDISVTLHFVNQWLEGNVLENPCK
jgi:tetratricopeptide (TPR) repeat protein